MENVVSGTMTYHSSWFFLAIIPFALIFLWNFIRRSQRNPVMQFSQIAQLAKVSPGWRAKIYWLPDALKFLAILYAIIALARPQTSDTQTKRNVEGIDIMIALDISDSMLIEDMKPFNRLEAAKETIRAFVKGRQSDRIGVVIFAGESFTLVPLTLDYDLLSSRMEEVTTAQQAHIKDGTAIGVAMANAAGKLKDSTAKTKVIIFMTDGENNSGLIDPLTGLEIAKGYGVKVYSIGIGRSGPTKIPIYQRDVFGNKVKTYQPFDSTVNDELLQKMATDTGGKYYRASKEDSLGPIFKDIDKLERTKIDVNRFTRYNEHFQRYALIAFCLYALSIILNAIGLRRTV